MLHSTRLSPMVLTWMKMSFSLMLLQSISHRYYNIALRYYTYTFICLHIMDSSTCWYCNRGWIYNIQGINEDDSVHFLLYEENGLWYYANDGYIDHTSPTRTNKAAIGAKLWHMAKHGLYELPKWVTRGKQPWLNYINMWTESQS